MPRTEVVYLVVRSDGKVRAAKRPQLSTDEVAIAVTLTFPDGWGRVTQHLSVTMPEPPVATEPEVVQP